MKDEKYLPNKEKSEILKELIKFDKDWLKLVRKHIKILNKILKENDQKINE